MTKDQTRDKILAVVTQEINVLKSGLTRVIVNSQDATGMIRSYLMSRMTLMKDAVNYHESLKAVEIPFYHQHKIAEYEQTIAELLDILIKGLEKPRLN